MRIGVMVGPERGRYRTKVDRLRADARWADEAGLASVWVPQIPDDFDALTLNVQNWPAAYPNMSAGSAGTSSTNDRVSWVSWTTSLTLRRW